MYYTYKLYYVCTDVCTIVCDKNEYNLEHDQVLGGALHLPSACTPMLSCDPADIRGDGGVRTSGLM